jgi:hypothetical protein
LAFDEWGIHTYGKREGYDNAVGGILRMYKELDTPELYISRFGTEPWMTENIEIKLMNFLSKIYPKLQSEAANHPTLSRHSVCRDALPAAGKDFADDINGINKQVHGSSKE